MQRTTTGSRWCDRCIPQADPLPAAHSPACRLQACRQRARLTPTCTLLRTPTATGRQVQAEPACCVCRWSSRALCAMQPGLAARARRRVAAACSRRARELLHSVLVPPIHSHSVRSGRLTARRRRSRLPAQQAWRYEPFDNPPPPYINGCHAQASADSSSLCRWSSHAPSATQPSWVAHARLRWAAQALALSQCVVPLLTSEAHVLSAPPTRLLNPQVQ